MQPKLLSMVIAALLCFLTITPSQAWAYNPPDGLNKSTITADPSKPKGHGTMGLKALDVLQGDGYNDIYSFYNSYRQQILDGEMQPDTFGTPFKVSVPYVYTTPELPGSSFSHFHNPATGKGFVLDFSKYNFALDASKFFSIGPWELYTMSGPQPSSTDMADWAYAEAVEQMRKGNTAAAITKIGWVLHYIQDTTVPQHATDEGAQKPGSMHVAYEEAVDTYLSRIAHATRGGVYNDTWRPGQFVEEAAKRSSPLVAMAKDATTFEQVARQMVPVAEQLSAGLLARFYRQWRSENFSVVVLTVERVKAIPGTNSWGWRYPAYDVDYPDQADFFPKVTVETKNYTASTIDGGDDITPNKLLPFSWVFPKWINNRTATVPIKLEIWDKDGVTKDDLVDVSPNSSSRLLNFSYLADGQIQGDINAFGNVSKTSVTTQGDNRNTRAQIWFNLQRFPSL